MRREWSEEEIKLLKENYNKLTNDELVKLFPDRTFLSLYKKARSLDIYKDKNIEFKNRSKAKSGEKSVNWNGGRRRTRKGYIEKKRPNHPRADRYGYVMEHILVFEDATGIQVSKNCVIHHLNGIKDDNRIENLCMMEYSAHTVFHHLGKKRSKETCQHISESKRKKHE